MVGLFVNTIVLRGDVSGAPTFRELLRRVRTTTLAAFANQDVPFEKVVDHVQPERDLRQSPLFQVFFALQNAPREALQLPGLRVEPIESFPPQAKFDLALDLTEMPDGAMVGADHISDGSLQPRLDVATRSAPLRSP